MQILDYSNSQLIKINTGPAKVQNGTFKIIHIIELEGYEKLIASLEDTLYPESNHSLYPFLSHEVQVIKNHLQRLKIKTKNKRSLNFIGTAWKWIAGSPDHHDHEIIKNKMNNVLINNNRQTVINKLTVGRINEITNITNKILRTLKENSQDKDRIIWEIKYKLDIIKEEVVNVAYALHWAKANIVNSYILTSSEISIAEQILKNIPFVNIDEAFEFTNVKIASDGKNIIYIISLPTTGPNSCNTFLLKTVRTGIKINKIPYDSILECKDKLYGIINKCQSFNSHTICSLSDIIDISNSTCIPKLLKSQISTCPLVNNQHIPSMEEISPDVLFLNQFNGPVRVDNETIWLNGTYIIKHVNTRIEVNNKLFETNEVTKHQPLPAILQPKSKAAAVEEELSLEMMKELSLNGTAQISLLNTKNTINLATNISLTVVVLLSIMFYLVPKLLRKKNKIDMKKHSETKSAASVVTLGLDDVSHFLKPMTSSNADVRS